MPPLPLATPDITPAQIGAQLVALLGQLVAWGLLSAHTEQLVISVGSIVLGVVVMIADAHIRHGRAKMVAAQLLHQLANQPATSTSSPAST